jgi:hypothetical protein
MNTLSISILAIRILALYIIVQGIFVLPAIAPIFTSDSSHTFSVFERLFLAASIFTPLVIGVIILTFSRKLGGWLSPGKTSGETINKVDFKELQAVAFSVLGVFAIVHSTPILIRTLVMRSNQTFQYLNHRTLWQEPYFVASVSTLAIGLFLFFGSKSLVRLYSWSKYLGHNTDTKS